MGDSSSDSDSDDSNDNCADMIRDSRDASAAAAATAAGLSNEEFQELQRFLLGRGLPRPRLAEAIGQLAKAAAATPVRACTARTRGGECASVCARPTASPLHCLTGQELTAGASRRSVLESFTLEAVAKGITDGRFRKIVVMVGAAKVLPFCCD